MSEQSPPSSPGAGRRRSSFTDMFVPRPSASTQSSSYSSPNTNTTTPMGNTQSNRRGMSITTLGLSGGSPNHNSPLNAFAKQRRASVSSSSASGSPEFRNSFEDSAVIEEDTQTGVPANTPATPSFARRVSFGAQALRDVRSPGAASAGRRPSLFATLQEKPENEPPRIETPSSSTVTTRGGSRGLFFSGSQCPLFFASAQIGTLLFRSHLLADTDHWIGEGFNWSEALRDRTKRQPSISAGGNPFQPRQRAASITTMEPPKEMPKPHSPPVAAKLGKPDQMGERMLRGDFMMD
jgi:hypothetical protein